MLFFLTPFIPEASLMQLDFRLFHAAYKPITKRGNMTAEDLEGYKYAFSAPGAVTSPINYYRAALRTDDMGSKGGKVTSPALIVWGRPDAALEYQMAEESAKMCDNCSVKYIEDSNHFVQMSNPDEANRLMKEFLG